MDLYFYVDSHLFLIIAYSPIIHGIKLYHTSDLYSQFPIFTSTVTDASTTMSANAIAVFIMLFIVNFSYSYGPIAWLYPAEIFPVHVRAQGTIVQSLKFFILNWIYLLVAIILNGGKEISAIN